MIAQKFQHPKLSLDEAYQLVAERVADGQHMYLPIFERLEYEISLNQKHNALILRAKLLAAQKKPIFDNH